MGASKMTGRVLISVGAGVLLHLAGWHVATHVPPAPKGFLGPVLTLFIHVGANIPVFKNPETNKLQVYPLVCAFVLVVLYLHISLTVYTEPYPNVDVVASVFALLSFTGIVAVMVGRVDTGKHPARAKPITVLNRMVRALLVAETSSFLALCGILFLNC